MVLLVSTQNILSAIKSYNLLRPNDYIDASPPYLDHASLAQISSTLLAQSLLKDQSDIENYRLHALLRDSKIYNPPKPPKPIPTPEFEALMVRLRHDEEERQYALLLAAETTERESVHDVVREISSQLSVILNILFSIIFTGLAVWFATSRSVIISKNIGVRVSMSLITALVVAIAETVLYVSYLTKMDTARSTEQALLESKDIHRSWELSVNGKGEREWVEIRSN